MQEIIQIAEKANQMFAECRFTEALSLYYLLLSKDVNNSISCCNIGMTYQMLGEYEMAVAYYKKSIRLDDKNIRSINNLARIYVEVVKDYTIAKQYLDYAISTNPNDAEAYNIYGNLSFIEEDYRLAESYFNKSIFLDEKFFKNYYDLAKTYIELNETLKAQTALRKCLELRADFTPAVELLNTIR